MTNSDEETMLQELAELAERFHDEATLSLNDAAASDAAVRRFKSGAVEIAKRYFLDPDFWPLVIDSLLDVVAKPSMPKRPLFDAALKRFEQSR